MEVIDEPVFSHPFTGIISGPTKAGKTVLAKRIVRNAGSLIFPPPEKIIWCFREFQPGYKDIMSLPNVELVEGMPDLDQLRSDAGTRKLIVMDDMMEAMDKKNCGLTDLFTRGCHHWNVSVFHIVQNLFYGNIRTARINSHYIILLRNPSDKLQAVQLARQLYPGKTLGFLETYKEACSQPFGYLVVDLAPETREELRLRTKIFPEEFTEVFCLQ